MSFRQVLFASSAAISLIAPITDASAQYRYYDRPALDQHRQQRPAQAVRPQQVDTRSATKPVAPAKKSVEQAAKPAPITSAVKPVEQVAKPAPVAPLTEEQAAAKAAVDELLAREPALIAAKAIPDPALARAAAAKHNAEEARLAALKAKQEADATKLRELQENNKAREEAKAAALKAKQDAQAKNAKVKVEPTKNKPVPATIAASTRVPVQPVLRMPEPEGLPVARKL